MPYGVLGLLAIEGVFLIFWSSGFIGGKYGLLHAGTFTLLFYRYLLISVLLLCYLLVRRQLHFGDWGQVRRAAGMGILGHGVWLVAVLEATRYGAPPGMIALVASLQPLVTGVVAGPILGERVSGLQWAGLMIGFFGVVFVVGDSLGTNEDVVWWVYLLPFISALSLTWSTVWQRKMELQSLGFLPVLQNLAIQCWATTIIIFPLAIGVEDMHADWNGDFIFALVWLTFVISLGAYGLLILLFKHAPASRVASLLYLSPPVAMVMDYFAFGNVVTINGMLGLLIAATGVILAHRGSHH